MDNTETQERIEALTTALALVTDTAKLRIRAMTTEAIIELGQTKMRQHHEALAMCRSIILSGEQMSETANATIDAAIGPRI